MIHQPPSIRAACTSAVAVTILWCASCVSIESIRQEAVQSVKAALASTSTIRADDLVAIANPVGEGFVIYSRRQMPRRDAQTIAWLYLGGIPYALNSETKRHTPAIPLVTDVPRDPWRYANLNHDTAESQVRVWLEDAAKREP